jgi:hypothetical protein
MATTNMKANSSPSLGALLVGIVDRPAVTIQGVLARRDVLTWLVPLLVLLFCLVPMVVVEAPYNVEIAQQQVRRQLEQMPEQQQKEASAQIETFTSAPFLVASGLVTGAIMLLIGMLAQSGLLYLGGLVAGGHVVFGHMFRVSVWSRLPYAINYLALAGFTAAAGHMVRYPGLSTLVATGNLLQDAKDPRFALLSGIDLFWLWHLVLVAVGLAAGVRLGRAGAIALTLVYAALSAAVTTLPTMLFSTG